MIVLKIAAVVIIVTSIILSGGTGCDESELDCALAQENYVIVQVSANIYAEVYGNYSKEDDEGNMGEAVPWPNVQLEITICKAGGEREVFNKVTNSAGVVPELCQATFNVYNQQDVKISIRVLSGFIPTYMGGGAYNPAIHYNHWLWGDAWLKWDRLKDLDWGATYYWSPSVCNRLYMP
ncbi:MAG: hypothetical protein JSV77_06595 [Dehalococcoidales bacterium]|nr:MAG: hypothetical protein JSV77_06595 [Dehalococcoidales bacterium]